MEWVPDIDYRGYKLTLLALEIEETEEKTGKTKTLTFQWLTDLKVTHLNAGEFANAGRSRWCILYELWFYANFSGQKPHTYCIAA